MRKEKSIEKFVTLKKKKKKSKNLAERKFSKKNSFQKFIFRLKIFLKEKRGWIRKEKKKKRVRNDFRLENPKRLKAQNCGLLINEERYSRGKIGFLN